MDDGSTCPRCGALLEDGACLECGQPGGEEIIEVDATPIGPGRGLEVQPEPLRDANAPHVELRRFEVRQQGGGGCCFAGCLGLGFLLFLLYRGFVSLF